MSLFFLLPTGLTIKTSLSGTTGVPNESSYITADPLNANAGWKLTTTGQMQAHSTGAGSGVWISATADDWARPIGMVDASQYWVRATNYSGSNPNNGDALNIWYNIQTTSPFWEWQQVGIGTTQGVIKMELATDSGGSNIIETGYYKGFAQVETGA